MISGLTGFISRYLLFEFRFSKKNNVAVVRVPTNHTQAFIYCWNILQTSYLHLHRNKRIWVSLQLILDSTQPCFAKGTESPHASG